MLSDSTDSAVFFFWHDLSHQSNPQMTRECRIVVALAPIRFRQCSMVMLPKVFSHQPLSLALQLRIRSSLYNRDSTGCIKGPNSVSGGMQDADTRTSSSLYTHFKASVNLVGRC